MNEMYTCAHCGQTFSRDDLTEVANGNLVCPDCLDEHYEQCEHCGQWYETEDGELDSVVVGFSWRTGSSVGYWCETCRDADTFECDDCGELCSRDRLYYDERGLQICCGCSDSWHYCEDCGALCHENDGYYDDYEGEWYCSSCWHSRESQPIHNYSYKPEADIRGRKGEDTSVELTFGLELEVDRGEDATDTARSIIEAAEGRVYCKHDGSLSNGFEIVSHPGTLAHHTYEMHWANICRLASKAGFQSHDAGTCGLHIHVGRRQLGCYWGGWNVDRPAVEEAENKLVVLVAKLTSELTVFSRRTQARLDDWAAMPYLDLHADDATLFSDCRSYIHGSRYHAVNFNNDGTVEFRIFRGTLKRDTIIASIQLVSNLCLYAKAHSLQDCKAVTYTDIVAVNPYKELVAYSTERNLPTPAQAA